MPYWNDIKVLLKPEKYGFIYQERFDLFYRDYFFLKCKKSTTSSGVNIHVWELENRDTRGKIKLTDEEMLKLFNKNPQFSYILNGSEA